MAGVAMTSRPAAATRVGHERIVMGSLSQRRLVLRSSDFHWPETVRRRADWIDHRSVLQPVAEHAFYGLPEHPPGRAGVPVPDHPARIERRHQVGRLLIRLA